MVHGDPVVAATTSPAEPTMRLAGPSDVPAILAFYRRLSEHSLLMRFSVANRDHLALVRAAQLDPGRSVVVVAVVPDAAGDRVVGEARCELTDDGQYEFGLAVQDEHQRRGLGSLLLERLREVARDRGVGSLRAVVRTDNGPMLRMLLMTGCAIVEPADGGQVAVDVSTGPGMPGWPADHRRPRVLVESRSWWATAGAAALRRAGYQVRQCQGPRSGAGRPCPLLVGDECPLVEGADVVACLLPEGDADCLAVAEIHRRQRPLRLTRTPGPDLIRETRDLLVARSSDK
jgi:GNAT superfamily N-acetyltransferase